jgi:hypothetical protein
MEDIYETELMESKPCSCQEKKGCGCHGNYVPTKTEKAISKGFGILAFITVTLLLIAASTTAIRKTING